MEGSVSPDNVYDEIPDVKEIRFGRLIAISLSTVTNGYTHGMHRYPAKFIPQIPRWAIRQYSKEGDRILDPFSGSGTTMVETIAGGREGIGSDLDHLACLIGNAKTAQLDPKRLQKLAIEVLSRSGTVPRELRVPMEGVKNFGHWFTDDAWAGLQAIDSAIDSVQMSDKERTFFLASFSSIIRAVSNADDQSQKTYVSGTLIKSAPPVFPTFQAKLHKNIAAITELEGNRKSSTVEIVRASATEMPIENEVVDLIVTSPPYLDSVDYMYNTMLEYFWLGSRFGLSSRGEYNHARVSGIGSKKSKKFSTTMPSVLNDMIDLNLVPDYRRSSIAPYFEGMEKHFIEAARVLKPGGRYVLIIGNSSTQNGMLPLHDALVALAASAGLNIEHAFGYRIRRHYMKFPRMGRGGIILMDWVITLHKGEAIDGLPQTLPFIDEKLPDSAVAN